MWRSWLVANMLHWGCPTLLLVQLLLLLLWWQRLLLLRNLPTRPDTTSACERC
jgi:hypothetical protein